MLKWAVDGELYSDSRGVTPAINYLADRSGRRLDVLKLPVGLAQHNPTDSPTQFNAEQALPAPTAPSWAADHRRHGSFWSAKST